MIRQFPIYSTVVAAAIAFATPASAQAAGPLEVKATVMVETRQRAADGTTRIALAPATRVVPGDTVVYVMAYRNTGAQPLGDVVLDNPLPDGLAYRQPAAGSAAPELSVDGSTYGALAGLRVKTAAGGSRAAVAGDVTHIRWRLAQPLAAGAQGQFAFQAVLK